MNLNKKVREILERNHDLGHKINRFNYTKATTQLLQAFKTIVLSKKQIRDVLEEKLRQYIPTKYILDFTVEAIHKASLANIDGRKDEV